MYQLLETLGFKKKIFFSIVVLISIFASILEVLGLGLLIPIISSLLDDTFYLKFNNYLLPYGYKTFTQDSFLYFCIILLPSIFILKNLFLFFFHYLEANLIFKSLRDFSKNIYKIFLFQKYEFYINESSSNFFTKLGSELIILQTYLISSVVFITESIILTFLIFFLLYFVFEEVIIIFLIVAASTFFFYFFFYKKIKNLGSSRKKFELKKTKTILETDSGIKEIKIYNRENIFENDFNRNNEKIYDFFKKYYVIQKIPKLFFEAISVLTVSIFLFVLLKNSSSSDIIVKLALVTGTIIRILPSLNKIIHSYNTRKYAMPSVKGVLSFSKRLKTKNFSINNDKQKFKDKILISNIKFNHKNKSGYQLIFDDLSLKIKKGDKISIMGDSGSGKSTLIDIILGFLFPEKGRITIDGTILKSQFFKNIISYCPQLIYIFDKSIEKNISLESNSAQINIKKINKLKKICCLNNFPNSKKNKGLLGEGGLKISGGQKQRIGIARALYFDREILILDESLNAIDLKTSKKILRNILENYPHLTVILVTHSKVLAKMTKKIYTIKDKKLKLNI
tara:strand:+ start:9003 stop:10700 length:1698 start_codon:yes stop_codon:yes gene_type:complete